jgi:hypothetical protein
MSLAGHPIVVSRWHGLEVAVARVDPCPAWVKRVGFVMSAICPIYPKQQTFPDPLGTSHLCQIPNSRQLSITRAPSLVGAIDPRWSHPNVQSP